MAIEDRMLAAQSDMLPWLKTFIDELLRTEGDLDAAAELVHVTVPELHGLRERNTILAKEWDKTLKTIRRIRAARLETVAYHEAAFGKRKYKFTPMGGPVMHPETEEPYFELERDNKLVMSLLQSLDRETYGPRQIVTGADGGAIQHVHVAATLADVVRIAALLDEGKIAPTEVVGEILDAEIVPPEEPE